MGAGDCALGSTILNIWYSPKIDYFIRTVHITSFIPGRVRLHDSALVGNTRRGRLLFEQLAVFPELDEVHISCLTGSVLIRYRPDKLHRNALLVRIENYIEKHVDRR